MKIEHIAVSSNNEEDSDRFFIELLDMKKERAFVVPDDLMEQFLVPRKNSDGFYLFLKDHFGNLYEIK
ncbi:MAG: hypothetical protein ACTSQL_09945 [Promethearchaeota archaeon]